MFSSGNSRANKKDSLLFCLYKNILYLCTPIKEQTISRSGAVVARWAHNPKVVGSNPASATIKKKTVSQLSRSFFTPIMYLISPYLFSLEKEYGASDFSIPLALFGSSDIVKSIVAPFIK